jgi:hypothetical protein
MAIVKRLSFQHGHHLLPEATGLGNDHTLWVVHGGKWGQLIVYGALTTPITWLQTMSRFRAGNFTCLSKEANYG